MYSVLIQNQKTIQIFEEYYPIFMETFQKDKIGICRWVESGTTIDMALPGLEELVADKEEWRAIILRVEDENEMSQFLSEPENPYDFKVNSEKSYQMNESPVPLIRLTQMLGGVPAPEVRFTAVVEDDGHHTARTVFKSEKIEETDAYEAYLRLSEKYEYDGRYPTELIILTMRSVKRRSGKDDTQTAWVNNQEDRSSDFWRRNHYPGVCRFLEYKYVKQGKNEKEADYLNFYLCVMMLATATIDPSSLQAYRLYNIRAEINRNAMLDIFQNKLDELTGCRYYVENEIRREFERKATEKNPAPDYKMDVLIDWRIPANMDAHVDTRAFKVVPTDVSNDEKRWKSLHTGAEYNLGMAYRDSERALDDSSFRMRQAAYIPDSQIKTIGKYEKQDMERELSGLFDNILSTQNSLSASRSDRYRKISEAAESVREVIIGRISSAGAAIIAIAIIMAVAVLSVTEILFLNKHKVGSIFGIIYWPVFLMIALIFTGAFIFIIQKLKLNKRIDKYNDALEDGVAVLTRDVKLFTNFATNIVSFSRGRSYLDRLRNKLVLQESEYEILNRHLDMINKTINKIERWAKAFYLPVGGNRAVEANYVLDVDVRPKDNAVYSLEYGREYDVPLNDTGKKIKSPVGFLDKLVIEREELFDNA